MKREKPGKKSVAELPTIVKLKAGDGNTISVAGGYGKSEIRVDSREPAVEGVQAKPEKKSRLRSVSIWFGIVGSSATILTFLIKTL